MNFGNFLVPVGRSPYQVVNSQYLLCKSQIFDQKINFFHYNYNFYAYLGQKTLIWFTKIKYFTFLDNFDNFDMGSVTLKASIWQRRTNNYLVLYIVVKVFQSAIQNRKHN